MFKVLLNLKSEKSAEGEGTNAFHTVSSGKVEFIWESRIKRNGRQLDVPSLLQPWSLVLRLAGVLVWP
jgi:hypothetical protein